MKMPKTLTVAAIKKAVQELAREAVDLNKDDNPDYLNDKVSEVVDAWWGAYINTGRISDLGLYPKGSHDIEFLRDAVTVMQALHDWLADDTGLWEGLSPWAAVLSQAFFTLEHAVGSKAEELQRVA